MRLAAAIPAVALLLAPQPAQAVEREFSRKGVRIQSDDGNFGLRLRGRAHLDAILADSGLTRYDDRFEMRRLRLGVLGTLYESWRFKVEREFAAARHGWRAVWLSYDGFERTRIVAGNQFVRASLETATSSDNRTFMERSLANALSPGTLLGVAVRWHADSGTVMGGVYREPLPGDDDETGDSSDKRDADHVSYIARTTYAPWHENRRVLHLGVWGEYRDVDRGSDYRLRTRPETGAGERLVNTRNMKDVDTAWTVGLQTAGVLGPFSVQAEYLRTDLDRSKRSDPTFSGWYAEGSYFLTGESRRYSVKRGGFGRVRPKRWFGAWQLAARYSAVDLENAGIDGGEEHDVTLGLNWYIDRNFRVMFNAVFADADRARDGRGDNPRFYQMRLQAAF